MRLSFAHVCIRTRDLSATVGFYTEGLGMTRAFDFTKEQRVVGCYLKMSDGSFIEIFEEPGGTGDSAVAHLCFETDDIDAAVARLRRIGVETTAKKLGCDNTHQIWLKDPNGIDIELHQYTGRSAQLTEENVEIDW